ncbi:KTSC domain-containing protein [Pantoea ananatis]|uniref:KTSC domain-containing protein n=1 Tax=Pantoea ananas TaxID=553 RepID=UPI000E22E83E|nr:KTSC domain-containing protein [Pantoea ananatis]REF09751.1 KTSC domain-containing protein [Pantoea ananatis]UYL01309.1 KTSC domain-containing protein [Pantoea ananatis]
MQRQNVASSNLRSVGYEPLSSTLEIEFNSGSIYQYFGVPSAIYHSLLSAGSKGGYFARVIKNSYRFIQVR